MRVSGEFRVESRELTPPACGHPPQEGDVMRANVLSGLRRPHPGPLLEEREIAGRGGETMKDEIVIRTIVLSC